MSKKILIENYRGFNIEFDVNYEKFQCETEDGHSKENHYFEVTDILINGKNLEVKAIEVGYWCNKFDRKNDFDLRNLIGLELTKVEDLTTIKKINEMSVWC